MHVAGLYRYPVKGFTREERDWLDVLPGGRIAGDRVLGLRYRGSIPDDDGWGSKVGFVALVNTPGLAALRLAFEHESRRLRLALADEVLFDGVLDDAGRARFAAAVERYVLGLGDSPLAARPDRLPLRVVGDGVTPRYQDREPGYVTVHGRASLAALAAAVDEDPATTEQRFRSNVALEGVEAWEEQRWVGRRLRIGDTVFDVAAPVTRCLATHAHPVSGERDRPIMQTLLRVFPAERPTFALLTTSARGGRIRVGDEAVPED